MATCSRRLWGEWPCRARALRVSLPGTGAPEDAVKALLEIVEAEAAQLRLKVDGGWPWETFRTERTIYRVQHGDAPAKSRIFRTLSMVPALALPPRWRSTSNTCICSTSRVNKRLGLEPITRYSAA